MLTEERWFLNEVLCSLMSSFGNASGVLDGVFSDGSSLALYLSYFVCPISLRDTELFNSDLSLQNLIHKPICSRSGFT